MTMLEEFVKERNEALFSLDRCKIEAYMKKYGELEVEEIPENLFWANAAVAGSAGGGKEFERVGW